MIVYLDTQDYIRTFNAPSGSREHQTLEKLLQLKDKGLCHFGYSAFILMEFISRPSDEYSKERIDRGRHIKRICGKSAFPWPSDLKGGARFPNGGFWLFSPAKPAVSLRPLLRSAEKKLKEKIREDKTLGRKERRRLASTTSLQEFIKKSGHRLGTKREDYGDLPVSDEFLENRTFDRLIRGEISMRQAEAEFTSWFCDPEHFSQILYDYYGTEDAVTKFFSGPLMKMEEIAETLSSALKMMREAEKRVAGLEREIDRFEQRYSIRVDRPSRFRFTPTEMTEAVEAIEGWIGKERAGHFAVYLRHFQKSPESFSKSDFFDLCHLIYAYEADLCRCDKKMKAILDRYEPFQGKLVSNFFDLPEAIVSSSRS